MRAIDDPRRAHVYRCFNADGELLYIGCSVDVTRRIIYHRCRTKWFGEVAEITKVRYPTKAEAMKAEAAAILAEHPRYNVRHNRDAGSVAAVVPEFHTTADLARAIGVHVSTVSRMVARGDITPAGRLTGIRGALLFHASEIERWRRVAA